MKKDLKENQIVIETQERVIIQKENYIKQVINSLKRENLESVPVFEVIETLRKEKEQLEQELVTARKENRFID
jgi:hypothetical protein